MLRKVNINEAISGFSSNYGVAILKRATGKLYIKFTGGECYAKTADGKYVFSADDNASVELGSRDPFNYASTDKKLKLSFVPAEINQFDFYLITRSVAVEDVIAQFADKKQAPVSDARVYQTQAPMAREAVAPVAVHVHIQNEIAKKPAKPSFTATSEVVSANQAFRNLLNS